MWSVERFGRVACRGFPRKICDEKQTQTAVLFAAGLAAFGMTPFGMTQIAMAQGGRGCFNVGGQRRRQDSRRRGAGNALRDGKETGRADQAGRGRVRAYGARAGAGQRPEAIFRPGNGRGLEGASNHTPIRDFKKSCAGLADGTGLPIEVLRRAHALPAIADYACSSIAAWGSATKDGHLYQTRNLDWEMHLTAQDHPCIVVYIPNEGIPHANITFAGCIGANTGMNARGIVLSEMGDSPGSEYPFDINGVHFTTLFRTVLYDADSLDKAVAIFKSADRIKKYHFVVGDGKNRKAVKMLAHAPNLIVWKDNDPQDELAPEVMKNLVYQDEGRGAFSPLKRVYGKIGRRR